MINKIQIKFTKDTLLRVCLPLLTAVTITVTGIIFRQSFIRILPLYVSLIIGALQTRANRYAFLIGGANSVLYALVYVYLGLYASAGYALLFSCPLQIVSFVLWNRKKRGQSTRFRRMSNKCRILVATGFAAAFTVLSLVLRAAGSSHQLLDNLNTLIGILNTVLAMLAFVEYTWLVIPGGALNMALNIATMQTNPEQITYVVLSAYTLICLVLQFFRVRKLYAEQRAEEEQTADGDGDEDPTEV